MAYQYDVFLSYLHECPSGPWVNDHFLPYFRHQLGNALGGRDARIFYDRDGIHCGQKWPAALKEALAHSSCLLGIWNPKYFHSQWCQNETAIMRHREVKLGYGSGDKKKEGLIVGVRVNDGNWFPQYAKDSQRADFGPYYVDGPGFRQTPLFVDFQKAIVPLSEDVARVVNGAPVWSAEWATAAWTDDIIAGIQVPAAPIVAQPLIT